VGGFVVYVDESGDEGFVFNDGGRGSSRWFVLSAVVTRSESDLETVRLVDGVRTTLRKPPREPLHFRALKHPHRLPFVEAIAAAKLRTVSVLAHKPSITEPEKFSEKHLFYRYVTRYLLERVSWFCRDNRNAEADRARIFFSNRSCMSYDDLRAYLRLLRERSNDFGVRIDWSVIDEERIEARTHDSLMGLQIADAVASSMYYGVEPTEFGHTEPRYAQMLKPTVYHHRGDYLGYGFKLWPREVVPLIPRKPELAWIHDTFRGK
jgi:hypothetical protein